VLAIVLDLAAAVTSLAYRIAYVSVFIHHLRPRFHDIVTFCTVPLK